LFPSIKPYFVCDGQALARLSESAARPYIRAMTASRIILAFVLLAAAAASAFAQTQHVAREQDIVGLRLGQRVMVDDGTCPAGQVKEVSGAKMTPSGVTPARTCVPRLAAKKK
jgi:hypothetical protein